MSMNSLQDLFEHELKDIFYAEHALVKALGEMAEESTDSKIKKGFQTHQKETEGHIKRLVKVFASFGEPPEEERCPGIEGLIKEKKSFSKEDPSPEVLDLFNVTAGQKSERYEITAYESLILMAEKLGMKEARKELEANLKEEEETLKKLQMIAESYDAAPAQSEAA